MKQRCNRGISALLALVMLIGLVSAPAVSARAEETGYIYNWGVREEQAEELSEAAEDFYADNQTSYDALAALPGAEKIPDVDDSALYEALAALMADNHHTCTSYGDVRYLMPYTDCQAEGDKISTFYIGSNVDSAWDGGKTWNREHIWPNSKGLGGDDENDIMMLRPALPYINSGRGNKAYGEGSDYYEPNLTAKYNVRGDIARIALYVYTRWGNTDLFGKSGVIESKEILLKWIQEDPVDTWELGRNDSVQSITGTRNVFVDYPELAFLLFGEPIPSGMETPSGQANYAYAVEAEVNDVSMGSVTVEGNRVIAEPVEGYMAAECQVIGGDATVTREGNVFILNATSDCTVRIVFVPRPQATVAFMNHDVLLTEITGLVDDAIILPQYTGTAPTGYTFLGWMETPVDKAETLPDLWQTGGDYLLSGDATFYALFSFKLSGSEAVRFTTVTCAHANTGDMAAKEVTCTEDGYTAGICCNDCGACVSGHERLTAPGHTYVAEVTPPTVTTDGYTTYTCFACGDSYIADVIPALGETYTISFVVPAGVTPVENMTCNQSGIELPAADVPAGYGDYVFLGWTTEPVESTTTAPVYYKSGENYVASGNITLYALYSLTEGGTGEYAWMLMTDASQLEAGRQVVITNVDATKALGTTQNKNNRTAAAITNNGDNTVTIGEDTAVLTLGAGAVEGSWSFYCDANGGYLYAASSSKNYLRTTETLDANGSFIIELGENGAAMVTAQGDKTRNQLRYNSGNELFACYAQGQEDVRFYIWAVNGSVRYTTELALLSVTAGDVNGDGEVDIFDANLIVGYYNGTANLTEEQLAAADVNSDGEVDIFDANLVVGYYNGTVSVLPAV